MMTTRRTLILFATWLAVLGSADAQLPEFRVMMSEADHRLLYDRDWWSNDYLPAPLTHEGVVHPSARIRFRGNTARFFPKKSYRIRFRRSALFPGGIRDVNLLSMYTDRSYLREKLCWDLFQEIGALTPEARYALLSINEKPEGVYLQIEKVDDYFLRRKGRVPGPLYSVRDRYALGDLRPQPDSLLKLYYDKEFGNPNDYSDLARLIDALNAVPDAGFVAAVDTLFDMGSVLNWFAVNTIVMATDSYNKNYTLYRDTSRTPRQWTVLPLDYDLSFGRAGTAALPYPAGLLIDWFEYNFPPLSGSSNVLKDRFLASPILMDRLRLRVKEILDSVFTEERYHAKVDSLARFIRPYVEREPQRWGTMQDFDDHVEALKYFVTVRRDFLYATFIHQPKGRQNDVTLPISQTNVPYTFVDSVGRTIATVTFEQFSGLDSLRVIAFQTTTPPNIPTPEANQHLNRWLRIFPLPGNATFSAKLQFHYIDQRVGATEVGAAVQDESMLMPHVWDGVWRHLDGSLNPYSNRVTIRSYTHAEAGVEKVLTMYVPPSIPRSWVNRPNFFWARFYGIEKDSLMGLTVVGEQGLVLRSFDGAQTWKAETLGTKFPAYDVVLDHANPRNLFVVGASGAVYRRGPNDTFWSHIRIGTTSTVRSIVFATPSRVYLCGDDGLFGVSADSGWTWNIRFLPERMNHHSLVVARNGRLVVAAGEGWLYSSSDSGATWTRTMNPSNKPIYKLASVTESELWGVGQAGAVVVSFDGGETWQDRSIPALALNHSMALRAIAAVGQEFVTVVGDGGAIYTTADRRLTWFRQHGWVPNDLHAIKYVSSTEGYVAGNNGLVLATTQPPILTSAALTPVIAADFHLFQNYPNPFNATTVIGYSIPVGAIHESPLHVTLKVFNLLGQEVATLVDEEKHPGTYEVRFEGSSLASGVYFYRLKVGTSIATKRMMLLK